MVLTSGPIVACELPFLEDHLIIRLCDIRQIEVWLGNQERRLGRSDLAVSSYESHVGGEEVLTFKHEEEKMRSQTAFSTSQLTSIPCVDQPLLLHPGGARRTRSKGRRYARLDKSLHDSISSAT